MPHTNEPQPEGRRKSALNLPLRQPNPHQNFFDLDRRLDPYALAAVAAGVGMLSLAQPAEAKVIYTKADQAIAPNTTIELDLNNDGIPDFELKDTFSTYFFSSFAQLAAVPVGQQNQVSGHTVWPRSYASAFFSGVPIGPKGQFLPKAGQMAAISFLGGASPLASSSCTAPWANVQHRYLGFKFVITGQIHFGWARLDVACAAVGTKVEGRLTGYAYETVPNRPILTGRETGPDQASNFKSTSPSSLFQGASLGRLALGASRVAAGLKNPKEGGI